MNKNRLLIPTLVVTSLTPTICLSGCVKGGNTHILDSGEGDFVEDPTFDYTVEQKISEPMTAEDATDVYFDDIAGQHTNGTGPNYEIIVQDIIYAYQKFYDIAASSITYTKFYVDLKLTNVDATNNKLSMEMKGEQEAVNAGSNAQLKLINVPYEIVKITPGQGRFNQGLVVPKDCGGATEESPIPEGFKQNKDGSIDYSFKSNDYPDGKHVFYTSENADKDLVGILLSAPPVNGTPQYLNNVTPI